LGRSFSVFFTPEDAAAGKPAAELALAAAQGSSRDEGWRVRKDGSRYWAGVVVNAIRGEGGELRGFAKVTRDLTGEREAEGRFSSLLEAAPDAMVIADPSGRIIVVNGNAERLFGWTRGELIGRGIETLLPDRSRRLGEGRPLQGLRKDGSEFPVEATVSPLATASGPLAISAIRDVTDRKRAEDALREQQALLDSIVENIPDMIFMKDAEQLRFVRLNRAAEEIIGLPREKLLGRSDHDLFPREQADFFVAQDRAALASAGLVDIPEEPLETKDRGTRILHTKKFALRGADGRPRWLLGLSEDVTERAETEARMRALNAELERRTLDLTAANAELEAFTSSVAHDLRAPIRQILGFAELVSEDYGERLDEEGRRRLEKVKAGARQMGRLVDDLLNLSRVGRQAVEFREVQLGELARRTAEEVQAEAAGREIEWRIGPLFTAVCDPGLMRQVFVNLFSNAIKYTRPRPRAVIEVFSEINEAGEGIVSVRDNGVGFDMRHAGKLFGIFQRLHAESEFEGTGVGLATVARVLRKHGGRIWARAEPGRGATFSFTVALEPKEGT
jgi:PAS domain S-box-containing protein